MKLGILGLMLKGSRHETASHEGKQTHITEHNRPAAAHE